MVRLAGVLCRILGLFFIVSAAVKALDPWGFAVQIQTYGIIRQALLVRMLALGVIAVEALLGATLLIGASIRGWTLRATGAMLAGFTVLIAYGWIFQGLDDCGCMGTYFPMAPFPSILKNLVMMGVAGFGMWGERRGMWGEWRTAWGNKATQDPATEPGMAAATPTGIQPARILLFLTALGAVLVILGASLISQSGSRETDNGAGLIDPTDPRGRTASGPYGRFVFALEDGSRRDLGVGAHVVAFLSASCEHCEASIPVINQTQAELAPLLPPVTGLMLGDGETLRAFRERSRPDFPVFLIDPLLFFERIGKAPPRFVLVSDGKPVAHWDEEFPDLETILPYLDDLQTQMETLSGGTGSPRDGVIGE